MKLILFAAIGTIGLSLAVQAAGLTQHQFMAQLGNQLVIIDELQDILDANEDLVMIGGSFPDAGFACGNRGMAEAAHSPAFITEFVEYIKELYAYPFAGQEPLIAFMMGVSSHVAADPPYHQLFITESADQDFWGNYDLAHTFCDAGLDFLTIMDHHRWFELPAFCVPVDDLLQVYDRMEQDCTEFDIILGNTIIYIAGILERAVTPMVYLPLWLVMPWTAENYYSYPEGGLYNGSELSAAYYETTWTSLLSPAVHQYGRRWELVHSVVSVDNGATTYDHHQAMLFHYARKCLDQGIMSVDIRREPTGFVLIEKPRIAKAQEFTALVNDLAASMLDLALTPELGTFQ